MLNRIRKPITVCVLSLVLLAAACPKTVDVLQKLSSVLSLAEPFVNSLGIVPEKLRPMITDLKDATPIASTLAQEIGDATTWQQKVAAANKAQVAWLAIVNRGHFQADARVMNVISLISAAFNSVATFYSDAPRSGPSVSEKEFAKQLDAQVEQIKAALNP